MKPSISIEYIQQPTMLMPRQKTILKNCLLKYLDEQKLIDDIALIKIETMLDEEEDIKFFTAHFLHKSKYYYESLVFVADFVKATIKLKT